MDEDNGAEHMDEEELLERLLGESPSNDNVRILRIAPQFLKPMSDAERVAGIIDSLSLQELKMITDEAAYEEDMKYRQVAVNVITGADRKALITKLVALLTNDK